MDCSLSGSSVHGILQARLLEWVAILFSRGSSWPKDWTRVSHIAGRFFSVWATKPKPGLPFSPFCNTVFVWGHPWEWNGIQLLFLVGWQLQIRAFACRLGHRFTLTITSFWWGAFSHWDSKGRLWGPFPKIGNPGFNQIQFLLKGGSFPWMCPLMPYCVNMVRAIPPFHFICVYLSFSVFVQEMFAEHLPWVGYFDGSWENEDEKTWSMPSRNV